MKYLSGSTNDTIESSLVAAGIGLMCQPGNSYHLRIGRFPFWAADNAAFGGNWREAEHLDWLASLPREGCLFAVSPDAYPDAVESQRRGLEYAGLIREMGYPVAIVAQDDSEQLYWPWDAFDCLFIGGQLREDPKKEWKTSDAAATLCKEARMAGKWVHMGRVNSYRRLERARLMGCHSADGTYVGKGPNLNAARMARFLRKLDYNQPLPLVRFEGASHPSHRGL